MLGLIRRRTGALAAAAAAAAMIGCLVLVSAALRAEDAKSATGPQAVDASPAESLQAGLSRASAEMAEAATNLWNALTPEQQKSMKFDFKDDERLNWNFVPIARKGLSWKQMT